MVASAADVARSREGVPPIIQWAVCGRSDGVIASWEMVLFAAEADDAERMWYLGTSRRPITDEAMLLSLVSRP